MIPGSTLKQAVDNMNGITNPLGKAGGSYITFGPETYLEKDGARWLGGKGKYNPIISIIHHILNVFKKNVPGYDADTHAEKIGVVLTMRDYVQVPHLDIDHLSEKDNHSWVYPYPLCHEGSRIYILRNVMGCKAEFLVKIPFRSILILREDVWHGGLIGGIGNVRLHSAIIANKHILSTKLLKYGSWNLKRAFSGMKLDYSSSVDLLRKSKTYAIKDIIPFMTKKLILDNNYYSVIEKY